MLVARHNDAVVAWAPAKVNLYLEILGKRSDGYHEIATLLVAISLFDTLELADVASSEIRLECDRLDLSIGSDNLVYRAAQLLRQRTGERRGATIRLRKRIPVAAGLGGGSSDAAAALAGLNVLWHLGLAAAELMAIGNELGSDVAFFFATGAAWCTGRGEVAAPLTLASSLWLVLVCPPFGLATADVYRVATVPDQPRDGTALLRAAKSGDVEELGRQLYNRLQPAALQLCPALADYRSRLLKLQPAGHLMSGSGSSWFALCRNPVEAQRIARGLRSGTEEANSPRVFIAQSCS
jgi:4-diphosphocytidyl-2-C-methyl-D-erythritol kinase